MEETLNSTKKFDDFKIITGNRSIDKNHVKNLMNSIKEKNLLKLKPILIDENFYVLDGQHRLEAAKLLDIPIYYIQIKEAKYLDIIQLNQNQKNWKLNDFVNFHAIQLKNQNYMEILKILSKYSWDLNDFFIYSEYRIKKTMERKSFQDGSYIFCLDLELLDKRYSQWNFFYDLAEEKQLEHRDCIKTLVFKESLLLLSKSEKIQIDEFWIRLRAKPSLFHRCMNKDEYIDMFLKIYNSNSHYKIEKGMLF